MALKESDYIPNGRTEINAIVFDQTGKWALTVDLNGRFVLVNNLTTTPVEILAFSPTTNLLTAQGIAGQAVNFVIPRFTAATRPAAGNAGAIIWRTDISVLQVDDGAVWSTFSVTSPTGTGYTKVTAGVFNAAAQTTPIPASDGGLGVNSPTAHGILVGEGTSAVNPIVLTNGQLLVGSTGADPVASLPSVTAANMTAVGGAGTLTLAVLLHGQCRSAFVSATSIKLSPYNGANIVVNGVVFQLSSSGVTAANTNVFVNGVAGQNLGASTTYFVYLFNNAGTLTIDFSTTTHATDATAANLGVEIKSGDSTRTLVGMIRTNGSSQFEDDNSLRGVISWFNRRSIGLVNNFTVARTTTSATYVELNTEIRGNFVTWGDEAVVVHASATVQNDTLSNNTSTAIAFDGSNQARASIITVVSANNVVTGVTLGEVENGLSEGFHFTTLLGASAGVHVGTWWGSAFVSNTTPVATTTLTVGIRG